MNSLGIKEKVPHECRTFPDIIHGLLSPLYDGHVCGLNPDADAEQVQSICNALYMLCQVA